VAFFGGVPAITVIALMNAVRLRAPRRVLAMIAGAGVLGMAAVLTFLEVFFGSGADDAGPTGLEIGVQVISVLAWGLMFLAQRQWDRIYQVYSSAPEPYTSLVAPGLVAVIFGFAITLEIVIAVSG
jgi:hypothetical protein